MNEDQGGNANLLIGRHCRADREIGIPGGVPGGFKSAFAINSMPDILKAP
jgi:hypothetical protein